MSTIRLQSCDGREFSVPLEVARCSRTITNILEYLVVDESDQVVVVPLANVTGPVLEKVIEWATYHKDEPLQQVNNSNPNIGVWDAEFLKMDKNDLFALTQAANYLDIKGLLDLTCKTVATMIQGKSSAELRDIFALEVHKIQIE